MTDWPFVSIVVPVFNGGHTIDDLLQSLLALNYPRNRYEIIVVDNNSTDGTSKRVQGFPIRLLHERAIQSSYAARNRGVRAAKGDIVAFTDVDCVAHPDWLQYLLADHQDPQWGGFAGGFEAFQPRSDVQRHLASTDAGGFTPEFIHQPLLAPQSLGELLCSRFKLLNYRTHVSLLADLVNPPTANVAYRRLLFDEIGYFDARFTSGGDVEFAWRVQLQTDCRIKVIPEAIIYHRHRFDLAGMAQQFRKNGWGYGLLVLVQTSKNGADHRWVALQLGIESLILIALSMARHSLNFGVRLLHSILHPPTDGLYIKTPVFTMVGSVNLYYGRLIAARKGYKWLFENKI